jgi:regulatory protein CII
MLYGMESHEVLRDVFQKVSPKQAAAELGLSVSMVYKWAEPPEQRSGAANPLDRVAALIACTQDTRIVQWICQKAGGFYIKNPRNHHTHALHLVPAMNSVVQEFADLLSVMAAAAADNQITETEAKSIRARWEELKTVTEEFVRCSEEGNFRQLKKVEHVKSIPHEVPAARGLGTAPGL